MQISKWQQNKFQWGHLLCSVPKAHAASHLSLHAIAYTGLELARVPQVPGTRRNSEHHLWHPWILRFLALTGTRRANSM